MGADQDQVARVVAHYDHLVNRCATLRDELEHLWGETIDDDTAHAVHAAAQMMETARREALRARRETMAAV